MKKDQGTFPLYAWWSVALREKCGTAWLFLVEWFSKGISSKFYGYFAFNPLIWTWSKSCLIKNCHNIFKGILNQPKKYQATKTNETTISWDPFLTTHPNLT